MNHPPLSEAGDFLNYFPLIFSCFLVFQPRDTGSFIGRVADWFVFSTVRISLVFLGLDQWFSSVRINWFFFGLDFLVFLGLDLDCLFDHTKMH
jgi:hypothetical protein